MFSLIRRQPLEHTAVFRIQKYTTGFRKMCGKVRVHAVIRQRDGFPTAAAILENFLRVPAVGFQGFRSGNDEISDHFALFRIEENTIVAARRPAVREPADFQLHSECRMIQPCLAELRREFLLEHGKCGHATNSRDSAAGGKRRMRKDRESRRMTRAMSKSRIMGYDHFLFFRGTFGKNHEP